MPYPIDTDVEFLAKIAHEIRQPLSAMQSALRLLKKCEDTRVREHAYRAIERQIEHMTRLLDDLIAAAARGRPPLQVHRSRFDLREVVDEAIDTVMPIASESGQRLDVSLPAHAVWIEADPFRMRQILSNLLSNALKHTRGGERVRVQIQHNLARISLEVSDNGRGIPGGSLRRIFDPFIQAENTASGCGLGLAIVKQLVELQGGTVEAFSASRTRQPLRRGLATADGGESRDHVGRASCRNRNAEGVLTWQLQSQLKHAPTRRSRPTYWPSSNGNRASRQTRSASPSRTVSSH